MDRTFPPNGREGDFPHYPEQVVIDKAFLDAVYEVVARIPRGKVATYVLVGEKAGYPRAAREVGHAMSHAPANRDLPYHRVVNKQGTLSPDYAFGGQDIQRRMLEEEGVTFHENGLINMERHLWSDYEQLTLF